MKVYPIFLNDLGGRRCLVIGGDHEAERKTNDLLQSGADDVTVISPDLNEGLHQLVTGQRVRWIDRPYQRGDLRDAFLVIISETNPERTAPIWEEAQNEKVLINAMDDIPHCSFVAGSVVRRGPLVVSISTSGAAPALSVRLREHVEEACGPEYETFLELMGRLRAPMAAHYPDFQARKKRWYELVDSDVLALIRQGDYDAAHRRLAEIVGEDVAAEAPFL